MKETREEGYQDHEVYLQFIKGGGRARVTKTDLENYPLKMLLSKLREKNNFSGVRNGLETN